MKVKKLTIKTASQPKHSNCAANRVFRVIDTGTDYEVISNKFGLFIDYRDAVVTK